MHVFLKIRLTHLGLFTCLAVGAGAFAQTDLLPKHSGPRNRILGQIVDAESVALTGNTHPFARAQFDRGELPADTPLDRLVLVLRPDSGQQRQLDALTEAQQDSAAPEYRQWLTPEQYGQRFGISAGDLARVTGWLEGHGFAVEAIPASRRLIVFSGNAAQVAEAFHVQLHRYRVGDQEHIANVQDPEIPKALAPVVEGILSLHNFRRVSALQSRRAVLGPDYTQGSTHYLFPTDFAAIYNLNPLYTAGQNGSGSTIAIVGRSLISLDDVRAFRTTAGLSTTVMPSMLLYGPSPGKVPGDQDEATLDVEWSGAVAPAATVKYVVAGSSATTDGVDLSAQYIVNNKTALVMSTSFGNCEANMGSAELAFYNSLWQQAASEGISSFVSSGDSGAAGCNRGSASSGSKAGVNGLCSSPYATCVGGTEFNEGSSSGYWGATNGAGGASALGYIPESAWNESGSNGGSGLWSTGGGISNTYPQPTWQKGISGANSNGMRAVPDVSLTAASHDGYLVYLNGNWYVFAGTSASSPSFAGILAVIEQKLKSGGQGNANPILYGLPGGSVNPFHSTPAGNNSVPGVAGFTASGAVYNLATGLGSVDAEQLARAWPSSDDGGKPPSFTLSPSVTTLTVAAGKTATFSIAVAGTGSFQGLVALTAGAPSGVSVSFAPASVQSGQSAVARVVLGAGAASGVITISGSSGLVVKTATIRLNVLSTPTLSIQAGSSKVSVVQGKSASLPVTITTGGSFSGTVTLGVTGLPPGVTASWSASTFKASGTSSMGSTLILKATGDAKLSSGTLTITAKGEGLKAQTSCGVQVTPIALRRIH